jgi:hypothetical protein
MHGVADVVEGPYSWNLPNVTIRGENPAAVVYTNASTGKTMYSLWTGPEVIVADSVNGPWTSVDGTTPGGNPAPLFHNGAFYATTQHTSNIVTSTSLGGPWTVFANITVPWVTKGRREDPFMWIDKRGAWHIINHAYDTSQHDHCGSSTLSAHQFSPDGVEWHMVVPNVEPYGHTVHYDDGTSHTCVRVDNRPHPTPIPPTRCRELSLLNRHSDWREITRRKNIVLCFFLRQPESKDARCTCSHTHISLSPGAHLPSLESLSFLIAPLKCHDQCCHRCHSGCANPDLTDIVVTIVL